jgi:hypothetical protein
MYRVKIYNVLTNEESLAWEHYNIEKKKYILYKDIDLKEELDSKEYKLVRDESDNTPFYLFGIECGFGWLNLIKPIIRYIDVYNHSKESEEDKISILQIKEKYGELRIYVSHGTKELFDMIDRAEKESRNTCEICGSEKNIGCTLGYIQTICHDCIKKECIDKDSTRQWLSYGDKNIYTICSNKDDVLVCSEEEYKTKY